ncbi:MAG: nucleotide pyrophosphohydrolase [Sulfurovum sp.]|nr:nucleotide pyrophosphohydrolase [Sulfurovum sp.]
MSNLNDLKQKLVDFRDERDWKQFHNPKDLSQAISIEASELLEHFLWISQKGSHKIVQDNKEDIADEMADIFAYLLSLSDITGIDLEDALINKLEKNKQKYPIEKSKGIATKYTKLI